LGECFQNALSAGKHQGIDFFLVFPSMIPELFGEGKGDQIVVGRQALAQLIFDPLLVFMVLAMGTVPMATGMWNVDLLFAIVIGTLCQHMWAMLLSALHHSL